MDPRFEEALVQVLMVPIDEASAGPCLVLARELRATGITCIVEGRPGQLRKKLEYANKLRAYYIIVIGPDDLAAGTAQVRDLDEGTQEAVAISDIPGRLAPMLVDHDELRRLESARQVKEFMAATP